MTRSIYLPNNWHPGYVSSPSYVHKLAFALKFGVKWCKVAADHENPASSFIECSSVWLVESSPCLTFFSWEKLGWWGWWWPTFKHRIYKPYMPFHVHIIYFIVQVPVSLSCECHCSLIIPCLKNAWLTLPYLNGWLFSILTSMN